LSFVNEGGGNKDSNSKVLVDFRIFPDRIEKPILEVGYIHKDCGFRRGRNAGQGDSL
jgi:hypothetical protein